MFENRVRIEPQQRPDIGSLPEMKIGRKSGPDIGRQEYRAGSLDIGLISGPDGLQCTLKGKFVSESVPSAPRGPSDRSRTCITMVWIDTKYTNTHRPTARRRARSLGLGTPLAGNFFDLSREDLTSSRLLLLLIADELPARRAAQDTMRIAY